MPLFAHVAVIFGRFLGIFRLSSAIWSQTAVGKRQGARDFEPPVFPVQGFTRTPVVPPQGSTNTRPLVSWGMFSLDNMATVYS